MSNFLVPSKGDRTRLRILEASIQCFVRKGFDGASFTELAKSSKVNRGLFVHYFGTKQALIEQAFAFASGHLHEFTNEKMVARTDVPDPIARYVEVNFDWLAEHPEFANYVVYCIQRSNYDPGIAKIIRANFRAGWSRLAGVIEGRYPVSSPFGVAQQVHSIVVGAMIMSITMGSELLETYRGHCLKSIEQALRG